jgi:hypothetical protein
MSWILPDPDPAGLPAAVWLLEFLLVFTFILHVLVMNVVLGGGLVSGWATWRARRSGRRGSSALEARYRAMAGALAKLLPVSTAFAITTGVAPLLFVQVLYGQLFYSSSVLMAWVWFAVVPLLLVGYYGYYGLSFVLGGVQRGGPGGVASPAAGEAEGAGVASAPAKALLLAAGSGLVFLVIALVFTNNMTLMLRPDRFGALYAASDAGLHANLGDSWVWPRFLHVAVGSLAVTGIVIGLVGRLRKRSDPSVGRWITAFGARLFILATLVQLAVGVWFLFSLPHVVRDVVLSGGPELMLLATGIGFALLAMLVVGRSVVLAAVPLVVTIVDMVIVRHQVRRLTLVPYFSVDSLAISAQTGVFILFALLLVAGLAVVAWMVWRLAAARPAVTAE